LRPSCSPSHLDFVAWSCRHRLSLLSSSH
jgi:hypothetical protein